MKDYKIFLTPQNETWEQAIERYIAFSEADMKDYFEKQDSYRFVNNKAYTYHPATKIPQEYLDGFSAEHQLKIPPALNQLLTVHGTFMIGNELFEIFHHKKGLMTFVQAMEIYRYHAILKDMKLGMLKSLNQFYFFFGVTFPQTDETSFLYFNRAGHFGKMYIDNTNLDLTFKKILPAMFSGTIDKYSLDTLISNQLDRVIINALMVKGYIE